MAPSFSLHSRVVVFGLGNMSSVKLIYWHISRESDLGEGVRASEYEFEGDPTQSFFGICIITFDLNGIPHSYCLISLRWLDSKASVWLVQGESGWCSCFPLLPWTKPSSHACCHGSTPGSYHPAPKLSFSSPAFCLSFESRSPCSPYWLQSHSKNWAHRGLFF